MKINLATAVSAGYHPHSNQSKDVADHTAGTGKMDSEPCFSLNLNDPKMGAGRVLTSASLFRPR